jgi:hypothetical protein
VLEVTKEEKNDKGRKKNAPSQCNNKKSHFRQQDKPKTPTSTTTQMNQGPSQILKSSDKKNIKGSSNVFLDYLSTILQVSVFPAPLSPLITIDWSRLLITLPHSNPPLPLPLLLLLPLLLPAVVAVVAAAAPSSRNGDCLPVVMRW